nr:ABC transporter permease [uncultured Clostridium sp.]
MIKLINYEMKKHFYKRSLIIALLIFSIIDVMKISSIYQKNSLITDTDSSKWYEVFWELYDEYGGRITSEKIEKLLSVYRPIEKLTADLTASRRMDNPDTYTGNVYSDYYLLTWYYIQPMEYAYMYKSTANDIVRRAEENITFFHDLGNEYKVNENKKIAKLFSGRVITNFSYTEMYQNYLKYNFSSLLVLLICIYGLVGVFVVEKESNMDMLLLTTEAGGKKTITAKLLASMFFVLFVCLWFWLLDFVVFGLVFHSFEATDSPIFALKSYENASVNLTLGQYSVISALIRTGGMLIIGLAFLLISLRSKNALIPFIWNIILVSIIVIFNEILTGSDYILAKIINPFILVGNNALFSKVEFINFFGVPIFSYFAASGFAALSGIILIILIYKLAKKNVIEKRR